MLLLNPETSPGDSSPNDLNPSSVLDKDILEGVPKQRVMRLGSEIIKNPDDPDYASVKSSRTPHQTNQWPLLYKSSKSGMVRKSKSPHSTPTYCVRKPGGKLYAILRTGSGRWVLSDPDGESDIHTTQGAPGAAYLGVVNDITRDLEYPMTFNRFVN
ncbi:Pol protein [Phytophthora palmivora]|uniref:Pol protein n=1 Tax=Phytophthora palmivora TaxID=4796 RepID=A0A2P4YQ65_9STRA|nr:Pol protein [Phytophthora palmivora]